MAAYPAVILFADRARMVRPDYHITPDNAAWLAQICRRLDGVPLALEMAAARMNLLSAQELADRLDDAFRVLAHGRHTALPRQQTLHATLDWSYGLLNGDERLLLQRLAVFAGGFTLAAAEAVGAGEGLAAGRVLDMLGSLAEKSMVSADHHSGADTRYRLLEMVRQYCAEKLVAADDSARVRRRHRDYFTPFDARQGPAQNLPHRFDLAGDLTREYDNLRQALAWSFSDPSDIQAGPRLVMAVNDRWPTHEEMVDWYVRAVAFCENQPNMPTRLHVALLGLAAIAATLNDLPTAIRWHTRAVDLLRRLDPDAKVALMLNLYILGNHFLEGLRDVEQARPFITEADSIFQDLWPDESSPSPTRIPWLEGFRPFLKAHMALLRGQYQLALTQASESIRLFAANDEHGESLRARVVRGNAYLGLGEFDQARAELQAAVRLPDNPSIPEAQIQKAYAIRCQGMVEFRAGNSAQALVYCRESLRLAAQVPDRNIIASGLGLAALIGAAQGQAARAATLAGASAALWKRQGRNPWEDSALDTLFPGRRDRPDQAALSAAYAHGQLMDADEGMAYALGDGD